MIKRIQLSIPVAEAEVKSQGIADSTAQLLIELDDTSDLVTSIRAILARARGSSTSIAAVYINPFKTVRIASAQLTTLSGFVCALIHSDDLTEAVQIPCEQLIVFPANESEMGQLRVRLDSAESAWWNISRQNFIGALTHARRLINPIIAYESTNNLLDVLGDEETIRRIFEESNPTGTQPMIG